MTLIDLQRKALLPLYKQANDAHPGLLLQRGYAAHDDGNGENPTKTAHLQRVCNLPAPRLHQHAYRRWLKATADNDRFVTLVLRLESRLLIGLSGSGMLETGCAIHHSYGAPYIPGSSVKGVVNAFARSRPGFDRAWCDQLLGAAAEDGDHPDGLSGLIQFHDAWWVPGSQPKPLVEEVVTSHHPDYYGKEGEVPASDLDSPVPNAQVAVQGSFLFTIEGPTEWLPLAREMVRDALTAWGIGARTRSGFGLMTDCPEGDAAVKTIQDTSRQELAEAAAARQAAIDAHARQLELAGMSPAGRACRELEEQVFAFQQKGEMEQKKGREELIGTINRLIKQADDWGTSDRATAADQIARTYESIGWSDPGQKRGKREKQEAKRRAAVEALRQAGRSD